MARLRTILLVLLLPWPAAGFGASIEASWTSGASDNVAGYFLYIGTASRDYYAKINVADATRYTVRGLPTFTTYYFAVTAYNSARIESPYSNEAVISLLGLEPGNGTEIVEFRDPEMNRYFVTADPVEQAMIETQYGDRWRRTGLGFHAGGTVPVCRFHGNSRINPDTGQPWGPNTYFYTADMSVCVFLNQIYNPYGVSMENDRFDFSTSPAANGACPPGLTPVYRAYNNGFALGFESNHRFSTDRAAILEVVAQGWIDEGIHFCAP